MPTKDSVPTDLALKSKQELARRALKPQVKNETLSISDIDDVQGIVAGYFATKHVRDSAGDIIVDGAFKNTIIQRGPNGSGRIKVLRDHMDLIGRPLELEEDAIGLRHVSQISKTSLGMDTIILLMDEVLTEHSIGFDIVEAEFNDNGDFLLQVIRLWEGSFVTWGANEITPVLDVKNHPFAVDDSFTIKRLKDHHARVQRSLESNEWNTKEIPWFLQMALKQMSPLIESLDESVERRDAEKSMREDPARSVSSAVKEEQNDMELGDAVKQMYDSGDIDMDAYKKFKKLLGDESPLPKEDSTEVKAEEPGFDLDSLDLNLKGLDDLVAVEKAHNIDIDLTDSLTNFGNILGEQ